MVYERWIVTTDRPWSIDEPSASSCRTVRTEEADWPGPRKIKIVFVWFRVIYGLFVWDVRTVRGWAVARCRARRQWLRPWFWMGFVSMGFYECINVIPSDRFDMHKVFWALGHQWWWNPKGSKDIYEAWLRAKGERDWWGKLIDDV
jgi:hypothetical protein